MPPGSYGQLEGVAAQLLGVACAALLFVAALGGTGVEMLLRATSACLAAVTPAAVALLPGGAHSAVQRFAGSALVAVVLVIWGVLLVVPAVLGIGALCAERLHLGVRRRDASRRPSRPDVRGRVQGRAQCPPVQQGAEADPAYAEVAELGAGGTQG